MNILIVDDNSINRLLLRYMIQDKNHNIFEAKNGEIAIKMVKENNYDIIFMDMMMPLMDGYETTKHIKNIINENIPIYIVSAYQKELFPEKWKSIKYDGIISKPIDINIINNIINKYNKNI